MVNKVDVCINVYGKPWQTLCTLKTLMLHSGEHIDKIYFIEEKNQPYDDSVSWVVNYFDNIIKYQPEKYVFIKTNVDKNNFHDVLNIRYQYGIEYTDKNFIFITHNDVLYTADIIGDMLNKIGDSIGIGEIGQCWNCPANIDKMCGYGKFNDWNPIKSDVQKLELPYIRTYEHMINKETIKPMPECRLNEWACLLNVNLVKSDTTYFFGQYGGIDLGSIWFHDMYNKGYTFVDYRDNYIHGYWANNAGYPTQLNHSSYIEAENKAKDYYDTILSKTN